MDIGFELSADRGFDVNMSKSAQIIFALSFGR